MKGSVLTSAVMAAVLAVANASAAEKSDAPLSGAKRELERLHTDRGSPGGPAAKDGLKGGVPTLERPVETNPALKRISPEEMERERREQKEKDAQKNWLVDGVAKLEQEAKGDAVAPGAPADNSTAGENPTTIDTADPRYLLKLYDEQKKSEDSKAAAAKAQRAPAVNAFAPFLQNWMAASPVKDQLLSDLGRQAGGGTEGGNFMPAPGVSSGVRGSSGGTSPLVFGAETSTAARPNPYLPDPSANPSGQPGGYSPLLPGDASVALTGPATVVAAPAAPLILSIPESAPAERKAVPPPAADDKKYFPQLNRF